VTRCGRICFKSRKINLSHVFAGQKVGIKQVEEYLARQLHALWRHAVDYTAGGCLLSSCDDALWHSALTSW
jgi:hypothetical protein